MLVIIEKAILHILDFAGGAPVLSAQELELEQSTREFLAKHVEKTIGSQDAKTGKFYESSEFSSHLAAYQEGQASFAEFSQQVANALYQPLSHAEDIECADLFVCQIRADDTPQLVLFKCTNNHGYVHQVNVAEDGSVVTEVMNSCGLLPNLSQRMEEFAYINLDTKEVLIKAKRYSIDGNKVFVLPELLLECAQSPSPNETIKEISKAVKKVTEAYCQDQVEAAAAVKSYIAENLQPDGQLDPQEVGMAVFKDNPSMQADYRQEMENSGFSEPVVVNQEATLKKMRKHRLSTDTGIELVIPTEFFENTEFVEFYKDDDGFMSITLKNIQNITNK
ncbi:MAG: nucleoid-associated protein [Anaerovibrio sp.]|uniref:nucleoid-associated protein n=1 Tax=Anaerovibrio sp. TaxID=1872532 RepID=UPI0026265F9D|nr:nucleoid-associated protein [Anaerovibrio sp.]MDD7677157.1 nucleoid-associated protein [Anaerovibrio sp.]MDY2603670.1 nucleoid-associated protein [Anaerovibrio sp.]